MAKKNVPVNVEVNVTKSPKGKKQVEVAIDAPKKQPKDGSLAALILSTAANKYPYRNDKGMVMLDPKTRKKLSDEEYAEVARHRDICKELVRLSEGNNNFPYVALVYFAVGSDAHKKPVFDKGYKNINTQKAETILRWLNEFAKYNKNPKFFTCEKIVHAFSKFYDSYSKKDKDFRSVMRQFTKQPAAEGYKPSQYKTMQQFYDIFMKPLIAVAEVAEN